ncbi:MAG: T9SS type A sorting domain-containing protein, partial [Bacteroidales bacterium]|nr:T9SS type A sorting domain-containing protein [Bacteroidales bacterium]
APEPGEYILRVESATGGTDTDWLIISNDRETSAKYHNLSYGVNIYPNPANNHIMVELKSDKQANINIYSIEGKRIYFSSLNSSVKQIDISHFNRGIYIIEISDGISISREKIIKK